jgi:PAS domain S-box-containing protein
MIELSSNHFTDAWKKKTGINKKQFDSFFDKMLDGFAYHKIVIDKSGKPVDYIFLEVNLAFERLTGLKRQQVIGKTVTSALPGIEKDPADWIGVYGKVALTGEPAQFENHAKALNKWFKISAYCPKKGYFAAIFEDITERKIAQDELQKNERRLKKSQEIAHIGSWELDLVTNKLSWSDEVYRIFGLTPQKFAATYEAFLEAVHPDDRKSVDTAYSKSLQENKDSYEIEHRVIRKTTGEIRNVLEKCENIRDETGKIVRSLGMVQDITERKKAERKLELINEELEERVQKRTEEVSKERQRLYTILETLPAYVVLLDKEYQMTFANKVFRERFGESHGKPCYEYLFKLNSPCKNCETYKVLKNNAPHHWEWTGPDGRDYDIYDFPFSDTNGSTIILEMGIDITERKKMEKQLKDSERLAAIGLTAGMVGHDIRNPLQAITSEIYLAKTELDPQPDSDAKKTVLESLQEIENNVDYINKIVADLQDFSRPLNPRLEKIDLKSIIDKLLEKNGLPNNIDLEVRVDASAKNAVSDSTFINRILYNLVNNSVQAMPKGGKLSILANKKANKLVITVKDTGVGIPKAAKTKLFTPMFTTKAKGQGLGLAVIKRMTESLGGTVNCTSQKNKGTTFTIHLPQKKTKQQN